jgi:hypothetical protein
LRPTIADVFDHQSYNMNVEKLSYNIGGGSADAGPPTVKARPTAAAMAATIRAILIPDSRRRTYRDQKGSTNATEDRFRGFGVRLKHFQKKDPTNPK